MLLLSGLVMLGYVAWEYYGTDIVAKHKQAELRDDLRARWDYPTVGDVLGPQSGTASLGSLRRSSGSPRSAPTTRCR